MTLTPIERINLAVRAGVRPTLTEFLNMSDDMQREWAEAAERVAATHAVLTGLSAQGATPAAFVLAGAGDDGPLISRVLHEAHTRALEAEAKRPRGGA